MTDPTPDALLPCAYCGASDAHNQSDYSDENCVVCAVCDARGPMKRTYAEAIAAWNYRAGQSGDAGLLEALEEIAALTSKQQLSLTSKVYEVASAAIAAAKGTDHAE